MTDRTRLLSKCMTATLLAGALVVSACGEKQTYLPGKREPVRAILQDPALAAPLDPEVVDTARAIALAPQVNNPDWTQSVGSSGGPIIHPALRTALQPAWTADIGAGDSRKLRITADPVVSGGRIFTLDAGATVTATSTTGATLWSRDLTPTPDGRGQATGGGLTVSGQTLYVSIGYGVLAALDVATGGIRWTQDLDGSGSGTPTVAGDLVYVTAGDDTGWAVNTQDGRIAWRTGASTSINNVLGAPAPALAGQYVVFGFGSGEVQGLFREGGLQRWSASVAGSRPGRALSAVSDVTSGPVVSGDRIFVGNQSGRLSALSVDKGEALWTTRDGAVDRVWPAGDSIFALTDLNELVRLDAGTGQRVWGVQLPRFVQSRPKKQSEIFTHHGPVVAGGRVIVASSDGYLRSFDPVSGALVGTTEVPGGATTAPVVAGGTLYVVSTDGQLHAYR